MWPRTSVVHAFETSVPSGLRITEMHFYVVLQQSVLSAIGPTPVHSNVRHTSEGNFHVCGRLKCWVNIIFLGARLWTWISAMTLWNSQPPGPQLFCGSESWAMARILCFISWQTHRWGHRQQSSKTLKQHKRFCNFPLGKRETVRTHTVPS